MKPIPLPPHPHDPQSPYLSYAPTLSFVRFGFLDAPTVGPSVSLLRRLKNVFHAHRIASIGRVFLFYFFFLFCGPFDTSVQLPYRYFYSHYLLIH